MNQGKSLSSALQDVRRTQWVQLSETMRKQHFDYSLDLMSGFASAEVSPAGITTDGILTNEYGRWTLKDRYFLIVCKVRPLHAFMDLFCTAGEHSFLVAGPLRMTIMRRDGDSI